jgi:hypothetical protein
MQSAFDSTSPFLSEKPRLKELPSPFSCEGLPQIVDLRQPLPFCRDDAAYLGRQVGISVAAAAVVSALVAASAAGDEDDCKDDQPNPVIVKEIAQAVVHCRSSLKI